MAAAAIVLADASLRIDRVSDVDFAGEFRHCTAAAQQVNTVEITNLCRCRVHGGKAAAAVRWV